MCLALCCPLLSHISFLALGVTFSLTSSVMLPLPLFHCLYSCHEHYLFLSSLGVCLLWLQYTFQSDPPIHIFSISCHMFGIYSIYVNFYITDNLLFAFAFVLSGVLLLCSYILKESYFLFVFVVSMSAFCLFYTSTLLAHTNAVSMVISYFDHG